MTPMGRNVAISAIMTLLAVVAGAWWMANYERVEVDREVPLRGEAAYNSLYALKRALIVSGHEVSSRTSLDIGELGDHDTLILGSDVRTLSDAQVQDLLDWMGNGGSLLFALPSGMKGRDGELLAALGIKRGGDIHCVDTMGKAAAQDDGKRKRYPNCFTTFTFSEDAQADFDLLIGDTEDGYFIGRQSWGEGSWTVVGDLEFLDNQHLSRGIHADLTWQLLAPLLQGGRAHLIYASSLPPLRVLLVRHGWPVLVPALLALLAWLWWRSVRLGPVLPMAAAQRRALREHVDAAGEFIFRQRRASALYAPLRRAFDERLRREDPAVAALDGEDLVTAVAKLRGRPVAFVRQALLPADLNRPEGFLQAVKALSELGLHGSRTS